LRRWARWLPTVWLQIFSQHRTVKPPTQKEADILQIVEKEAEFGSLKEAVPDLAAQPPAETA
jgi:hypothetical protein